MELNNCFEEKKDSFIVQAEWIYETGKTRFSPAHFMSIVAIIAVISLMLFSHGCSSDVVEIIEEKDPYIYIAGSLQERETLAQALQERGVGYSMFMPVLNELNKLYDLRRLMPADSFHVQMDTLDVIHRLSYYPQRERIRSFSVYLDSLGFYVPSIDTLQVEMVLRKTEGTISGSLYSSLREFGEGPYLIGKFAEIFQWDVDFLIDPREGDRFCLVYEQYMLGDEFVKYGNIIVAEYESRNYDKRAYRFEIDDDHAKYFTSEGESFQRAFLRSPLNYSRITSRFSKGRYHPVLKIVRPHNGVDYAASMGTPVVASADGIVSHRGWKGGHPTVNGRQGGYGKTVMIRHNNNYETLYGHLNGYGPGISRGVRVEQNQVIGYVGQTGLATGPHLHYTVYHHGTAIDPLKMENVAGPPVPEKLMPDFRKIVERANYLIDTPNDEVGISLPLSVTQASE